MFQNYLNKALGNMRSFSLFLLDAIDIVTRFAVEKLDNIVPDRLTL